jgi:hypothetical protein
MYRYNDHVMELLKPNSAEYMYVSCYQYIIIDWLCHGMLRHFNWFLNKKISMVSFSSKFRIDSSQEKTIILRPFTRMFYVS